MATYLGKIAFSFSIKSATNYRCGYSTTNDITTVNNWLDGVESPAFTDLVDGTYYCFAVDRHTGIVLKKTVVIACNSSTPPPSAVPVLDMVVISEALISDPLRADFTEQQLS